MAQVEAALLGSGSRDNNDEYEHAVTSHNAGLPSNINNNINGRNTNNNKGSNISGNSKGNGSTGAEREGNTVRNPLVQSAASAEGFAGGPEGNNHNVDTSVDSFTEVTLHDEDINNHDDENASNEDRPFASEGEEVAMPFEVRIPIVLTCVTCTMVVALW